MAGDGKTLDDLAFAAKQDLGEAIDAWAEDFKRDTGDLGSFPTIDAIESALARLDSRTREILLAMASDAISSIDEGEAVDSKKESWPSAG